MAKLTIDQLPPYGFMRFEFEGIKDETHPDDWKGTEADWLKWLDDVTDVLNECAWPAYDRGAGWRNGGARGNAIDLTEVELRLLPLFRPEFARLAKGLLGGRAHDEMFAWEDDSGWPKSLSQYCPELPGSTDFTSIVYTKFLKVGYTPHQLKKRFQRPRAHQTAMLLGTDPKATYSYYVAATAGTPSFISGHCIQGVMAGCAAYALMKGYDKAMAKREAAHVRQWGADIGDRRVMAGVHYPADNIGSWITALRLVEHVFDDKTMASYLALMIEQSVLFNFLKKRIEPGAKHDPDAARVYKASWKVLGDALQEAHLKGSP